MDKYLIDQDRVRFPGSGSPVPGLTPYGFYDSDSVFVTECYKGMIWASHRLGYPIVDIEMIDVDFYACYEEAVNEYGKELNQFNIVNNMLVFQGQNLETLGSVNGRNVTGIGLGQVITLAKDYGSETGAGGRVDWKKGWIQVEAGKQDYDLQALWGDTQENCDHMEIKRIFHDRPPASARIYDPFSMTGMSYSNILNELGFGAYSPAVQFLMTPIFEDLLRMQGIEFNDMIRKSAYSFEIVNNKVRLFPIPTYGYRMHFEYILEKDRLSLSDSGSAGSIVSDYSNVPYVKPVYGQINEPGRQWIRKYFLACCKETLGMIRQKYQTVPIPGGETTLDGAELRQEAQTEKESLLENLREMLMQSGKFNQMEKQAEMTEQLITSLKGVPLYIYVGVWMCCCIIL
jgi:hypothetical protein